MIEMSRNFGFLIKLNVRICPKIAIVLCIFQQKIMGGLNLKTGSNVSLSGPTLFSLTISCRKVVLTQNPISTSPL
jgi:hypothetical protein